MSGNAYAQQSSYECSFIADKYPEGKSTSASCGLSPEKIFSTRYNQKAKWDHCDVERVSSYYDLKDFKVDLKNNVVSWNEYYGLIDEAKEELIKYRMDKDGVTEAEARESLSVKRDPNVSIYDIWSNSKIVDRYFYDQIKKELYSPPKLSPALLITFGKEGSNFSLYVSNSSGEAVLSEYVSNEESAWVHLRFGNCRANND